MLIHKLIFIIVNVQKGETQSDDIPQTVTLSKTSRVETQRHNLKIYTEW